MGVGKKAVFLRLCRRTNRGHSVSEADVLLTNV
jgi:hypothetical protein